MVILIPFYLRIGKHPCNYTNIKFDFALQFMQFVKEFAIILDYSN